MMRGRKERGVYQGDTDVRTEDKEKRGKEKKIYGKGRQKRRLEPRKKDSRLGCPSIKRNIFACC
jgi:hypothetical protein